MCNNPYLSLTPKLKVENPVVWRHHRSGWPYVVDLLRQHFHAEDGMRVLTSVEETLFAGEVVNEPWVGFIHEVPRHQYAFPDLARLMELDVWKASVRSCQGAWVISKYVRDFLQEQGVPFPISHIYYPTEEPLVPFSFPAFERSSPRTLLFIGEYLRDYRRFMRLRAPGYQKVLLRCPTLDRKGFDESEAGVKVVPYVENEEYDRLLSESSVFLALTDAPANTTIIECIARNTPVLVNRVGGVEEYLGPDYPLYYDDLEHATELLQDLARIAAAVVHHRRSRVRKFITGGHFVSSMQNTAVYRSLPNPRPRTSRFEQFDVTVSLFSYRRVHNLETIMSSLARQDYAGRFEIILWNNNDQYRGQIDEIVKRCGEDLEVIVIHSNDNFFCMPRLAQQVLMRGELFLTCDDDVIPGPSFITRFVQKYHEYGPKAVVCARGHVFIDHTLDYENPEQVWHTGNHMRFFDERSSDRQIHFFHADTCLIPRAILREASQFALPKPEFALVDDYWLSFVVSHFMGVPIWKIQADDVYEYAHDVDDPDVALWLNPDVHEARVNFYVHHMLKGWPKHVPVWPPVSPRLGEMAPRPGSG